METMWSSTRRLQLNKLKNFSLLQAMWSVLTSTCPPVRANPRRLKSAPLSTNVSLSRSTTLRWRAPARSSRRFASDSQRYLSLSVLLRIRVLPRSVSVNARITTCWCPTSFFKRRLASSSPTSTPLWQSSPAARQFSPEIPQLICRDSRARSPLRTKASRLCLKEAFGRTKGRKSELMKQVKVCACRIC